MATIKATFFTFEKRDNSTKKPSDGGTELSVTFKEDTDILNPQLEVHYTGLFNFNYVHVDFTGRYYKITDAVSIATNTYLVNCAHDVLANWIDEAKGQSVYAELSSYDYDIWLDDTRCMIGADFDMSVCGTVTPSIFMPLQNWGTPALMPHVGVISERGLLNGIDIVYGGAGSRIVQDFAEKSFLEVFKSGSPWDAVCEAYYTPFITAECHEVATTHDVKIWDRTYADVPVIMNPSPFSYSDTITIDVPSNMDFRFSDKYVKYYLIVPFSGVVNIPTSLVLAYYRDTGNEPVASITYSGDDISGQFAAEVSIGDVSLGMFGANLRLDMKLGGRETQQAVMARQGIMGGLGAAGAAIGAGAAFHTVAIGGALGAAAGVFKGAFDIPPIEQFGQFGGNAAMLALSGRMGAFKVVKLEADSNIDPATLTAIAGRPSAKITTIQNGYIKTENASVSLSALSEEITAFNNLLNGGIYVE